MSDHRLSRRGLAAALRWCESNGTWRGYRTLEELLAVAGDFVDGEVVRQARAGLAGAVTPDSFFSFSFCPPNPRLRQGQCYVGPATRDGRTGVVCLVVVPRRWARVLALMVYESRARS